MLNKSMLDIAYDILASKNAPIAFKEMWDAIVKAQELSEEDARKKVSRFYTNLSLDGRFVTLGENMWDLRSHHTFDKVHIDMNDVYRDVETISDDDEEEKEYIEMLDKETGKAVPEEEDAAAGYEKEEDGEEEKPSETEEIY